MNWLDILIIIVIAVAAFGGMRRGLIEMVLGVAGVILGVFLAGRYYETVGGWLPLENTDWSNVLGFVLILTVTLIIFFIAAKLITKLADIALLGWVNRLGGALLGALLAAIIMAAILAVITKYISWETVSDSFMARFFLDHFPLVLALLPSSFDSVKEWFN